MFKTKAQKRRLAQLDELVDLVIKITNVTNKHLRVYLDEGVAKLVFSTTDL